MNFGKIAVFHILAFPVDLPILPFPADLPYFASDISAGLPI